MNNWYIDADRIDANQAVFQNFEVKVSAFFTYASFNSIQVSQLEVKNPIQTITINNAIVSSMEATNINTSSFSINNTMFYPSEYTKVYEIDVIKQRLVILEEEIISLKEKS